MLLIGHLGAMWLFFISILLITGCQSTPLAPYLGKAELQASVLSGAPFRHQVVSKTDSVRSDRILHVYIEGDGRPWWTRYEIADDPTPRKLPMLSLMTLDDQDAVYLGRPCYFALEDSHCHNSWWTNARYASEIVNSMNHALDQLAADYDGLRLFGHSGGGALAVLIATQRDDVKAVVTLAGNLDIDAWTRHHGYSPLDRSLNPVAARLAQNIAQYHYVGSQDKVTPAALLQSANKKLGGRLTVIDELDHQCCWQQHWPAILEKIRQ